MVDTLTSPFPSLQELDTLKISQAERHILQFQALAREDPVFWLERFAGFKPWRKPPNSKGNDQLDMLKASLEWGKDDFFAHCHGSGKTALLAITAIQAFTAYSPYIKVIIIPADLGSGEDVLWPEIDTWRRKINENTKCDEYPDGFFNVFFGTPMRSLRWELPNSPECYIKIYNPLHSERGAGRKAKRILVLGDEVTIWGEEQFKLVMANKSGGTYTKAIFACNPLDSECLAYAKLEKNPMIRKIRVKAEDHPNVYNHLNPGDPGYMDGMISERYLKEMQETCAQEVDTGNYEDNPDYQARCLGMWPRGGMSHVLVGDKLFDSALGRELPRGVKVGGLDLSRGGDKTVLTIKDGQVISHIKVWTGVYIGTAKGCEGVTTSALADYCKLNGCYEINCDTTFNPAIAEDLASYGITIHHVNFGSKCRREIYDEAARKKIPEFNHVASEMAWLLREALQDGELAISDTIRPRYVELLRGDLKRRYEIKGKVKMIEQKKEFKARKKRSPDIGDSVMLANYKIGTGPMPDIVRVPA